MFALREHALTDLENLEIKRTGELLAKEYGVAFETNMVREKTAYRYLGKVELEKEAEEQRSRDRNREREEEMER